MPDSCWSDIRTREIHIGFRYSFFFQIWSRNTSFKHFEDLGYLKESHTPCFLTLCMFCLYLVQLLGDISALPSEELE